MSTSGALLGIETTAQQLAQKIAESLPATIASVALWDGPSPALTIKAIGTARPLGVPLPLWLRVPLATAPTHRAAFEDERPVFLNLDLTDQEAVREEVARALVPDLHAMYLLPIRLGGETVGVLAVGEMRSADREPMNVEKQERCRAILEEFLATSAHAWEAGRLRQQVRAMSSLLRMVRETFDARSSEDVLHTCASEVASWLGVPVRALQFRVDRSGDVQVVARYRFTESVTPADAAQVMLALIRSRTERHWPVGVMSVADDPLDPLHGQVPDGSRWTRVTLPLMSAERLLGLICLYVEDDLVLSEWELEAFRHRAEIASRALALVSTLEDSTSEREWLGRAAYETLSTSQRAAFREAVKGIDRLVATLLPDRVQKLSTEFGSSARDGGGQWSAFADAVAREVAAVLDGVRGEGPAAGAARPEVDLNSLVRHVTGMARTSLELPVDPNRPSVRLNLDLSSEPLVARTSPDLVVALLHAIENAADSMPAGGEIRVRTARENGHALISVQDRGVGVAALDDVFAPLVSSKGKPHMGLGLSVVRSVVDAHGGSASLLSREGGGALLQIKLPLVEGARATHVLDDEFRPTEERSIP